ncbi:unnamed protein product [Calypogeia fissa]
MASRVVASRSMLRRPFSSSFSRCQSRDLSGRTEWLSNAAVWDGRWQWQQQEKQQQKRFYAREAGGTQQKIATPNAAKNVKAKTATKKEEKKEQRERFIDLIDACLNAPSPLSPLKEKDRLRFLERERLGVISQERLREIEQEKALQKLAKAAAKKKAAKEAKEAIEGKAKPVEVQEEEDGLQIGSVVALSETETVIQLTAEEGKRLAKDCSRVMLKEDRERAKGEAVRLQLKKEALAALPQHLREAALMPDLTAFPKSRIPASLTPPIKGYVDDRATAAAQAVTVKKSR